MNLLKNYCISSRVLFPALLLFGSSSPLFSANEVFQNFSDNENLQEINSTTSVVEQVNNLFDSILPSEKALSFVKASFFIPGAFESPSENHRIASLHYMKTSRYILPSLGVKQKLFPFHVFF